MPVAALPIVQKLGAMAWLAAVAVSAGLVVSGCASNPTEGYAAGSLHPEGIQTVAVPILENATFHRNVEFDLTEALIKEIERRTPYKVVPQVRADTIFTGRIREVSTRGLSRSRQTGLSDEMMFNVTIDFEWRDLRTNQLLSARESYQTSTIFAPSNPSGEPIELGRFAAVEQLARDIVNEMQADW